MTLEDPYGWRACFVREQRDHLTALRHLRDAIDHAEQVGAYLPSGPLREVYVAAEKAIARAERNIARNTKEADR